MIKNEDIRMVNGVTLSLDAGTGAVQAVDNACVIISRSGGTFHGWSWRVILAAGEMRREWEERPKLPSGWEHDQDAGRVVCKNSSGCCLVVVRRHAQTSPYVDPKATHQQCAQIPDAITFIKATEP